MPRAIARFSPGEAFCARDFDEVTSPANAKNLLARYAAEGLLERLLPGVYCLTSLGVAAFGIDGDVRVEADTKHAEDSQEGDVAEPELASTVVYLDGIDRDVQLEVGIAEGSREGAASEPELASTTVYPSAEDVAKALARLRGWTIAPAGRTALSELGIVPPRATELTYVSTGSSLTYDYRGTTINFVHGRLRELVGIGETTRLVVQALRVTRKADASRSASPATSNGATSAASPAASSRAPSTQRLPGLDKATSKGRLPGVDGAPSEERQPGMDKAPSEERLPSTEAVMDSIARTFSGFQIDELKRDTPQLTRWLQDAISRIARLREEAVQTARLASVAAIDRHGQSDEPTRSNESSETLPSQGRRPKPKRGGRIPTTFAVAPGLDPKLFGYDPSLLDSATKSFRDALAHSIGNRS